MDYDKFLDRLQKLKEIRAQDNAKDKQPKIEKQRKDKVDKTSKEDSQGQDGR